MSCVTSAISLMRFRASSKPNDSVILGMRVGRPGAGTRKGCCVNVEVSPGTKARILQKEVVERSGYICAALNSVSETMWFSCQGFIYNPRREMLVKGDQSRIMHMLIPQPRLGGETQTERT